MYPIQVVPYLQKPNVSVDSKTHNSAFFNTSPGSQTWDFRIQDLHYKPVSNNFVKSVSGGDCENDIKGENS